MKTDSIYKTSLLAAALLLSATSCVKDELHDTPHPDYGKITVTADWTDRNRWIEWLRYRRIYEKLFRCSLR